MSEGQRGGDPLDTGGFFEELGEVPSEIAQRGEFYAAMLERQAEIISQLTQLRRTVGGPGAGLGGDATGLVRMSPEEVIHLETESWSLDTASPISATVSDITPGRLGRGEATDATEQTIVEATSDNTDVVMDVVALGSSVHIFDVDNDDNPESFVDYLYQYQTDPGGAWKTHDGMTGPFPVGRLEDPKPPLRGTALGPVYGFRIRYRAVETVEGVGDPIAVKNTQRSILKARAYSASDRGVTIPE